MGVPEPCEILVIHPGALGDVLQAVPALAALRRPATRLTFAGQARLGRLLTESGSVDATLPFDGLGLEALFAHEPAPPSLAERLHRFDRIVSWFGSRDTTYPGRLRALARECVIAPPVPADADRGPVWCHLVNTLAPWGVRTPARFRPLEPPEPWRRQARDLLEALGVSGGVRLLVMHPGSGGGWKRWPAERFADVIRRVGRQPGARVLVHTGPADREAGEQIMSRLNAPVLTLVEPNLLLLAGVLGEAAAYVGGDSGVSHLAAAVGVPAVILFPPATLERWRPWSPTATPIPATGSASEVEAVLRAVGPALEGGDRPTPG